MSGSILIAGIGNIFNRDDAFGVVVATELARAGTNRAGASAYPASVVDFGIRGFDLVLALLEDFELTIFVDSVQRGGSPGTIYVIEHDTKTAELNGEPEYFDNAHGLDPLKVLEMARSLGAKPGRVIVVGCEPETLQDDTGRIGLSGAVQDAVPAAMETIRSLVEEFSRTEVKK